MINISWFKFYIYRRNSIKCYCFNFYIIWILLYFSWNIWSIV